MTAEPTTEAAAAPEHRDRRGSDWYEEKLKSDSYLEERRDKARVIAHLCRRELQAAERIADLGSGTGIIKKALEAEFDKRIIGFELSSGAVVESGATIRADILRLPARDRSFDLLIMNHVYEHVADPGRLFSEAYRVLVPGGRTFVSAGSRFALIEPHYRLPFLSWLPTRLAGAYLRASGRGRSYEEIRFLSYGRLRDVMAAPGFRVRDLTRQAIDDLVALTWGPAWERVWRPFRSLPDPVVDRGLRSLSPQWFFMLERPV